MTRSMVFAGLLVLGTSVPAVAAAAAEHGCSDWSQAWPSGTLQIDDQLAPEPPEVGQPIERGAMRPDCELV